MALARIRQLAAHEVGHTLGPRRTTSSRAASTDGRASVMDYPHPLVALRADGTIDLSDAYARGVGAWDEVGDRLGLPGLPAGRGRDRRRSTRILADGLEARPRLPDRPGRAPVRQRAPAREPVGQRRRCRGRARSGDGGAARGAAPASARRDPRAAGRSRRSRRRWSRSTSTTATRSTAAAKALGGSDYTYALRGDGREPRTPASAAEQEARSPRSCARSRPRSSRLPEPILAASRRGRRATRPQRELFPRYTGVTFDPISPGRGRGGAHGLAAARARACGAARRAEGARPALPGLDEVLDRLLQATSQAATGRPTRPRSRARWSAWWRSG